jgi:hypothetical protein
MNERKKERKTEETLKTRGDSMKRRKQKNKNSQLEVKSMFVVQFLCST